MSSTWLSAIIGESSCLRITNSSVFQIPCHNFYSISYMKSPLKTFTRHLWTANHTARVALRSTCTWNNRPHVPYDPGSPLFHVEGGRNANSHSSLLIPKSLTHSSSPYKSSHNVKVYGCILDPRYYKYFIQIN